jgi:hypothetical protein
VQGVEVGGELPEGVAQHRLHDRQQQRQTGQQNHQQAQTQLGFSLDVDLAIGHWVLPGAAIDKLPKGETGAQS